MKRKLKNILMISLIIVMLGLTYFTMYYAKNHVSTNMDMANNMDINNDTINQNNSQMKENSDNNNSQAEESLEKQDGDNSQAEESLEKQDGDNSQTEEPPEKPDGDNSFETNEEDNSNLSTDDSNNMEMQRPNDIDNGALNMNVSLSYWYYIIFGCLGLVISLLIIYLIMSSFNKKTFKETFINKDKILIIILMSIILTGLIIYLDTFLTKTYFLENKLIIDQDNNNTSSLAVGVYEVDGDKVTISDDHESTEADTSVILVKNGGNATLKNLSIIKSAGDSSNTENSEFYGINAGILVTEGSTATIKNAKISTSAKGSNAVFATGEDAKIYISNSTITTTGESSSRGLDATYGGYIEANDVTIKTQGGSCASLATDRGEGTIVVSDSNLETNGSGSPIIYSTGDISIDNTEGTANSSQMVVIEGKNSATIDNSKLKATGTGNRGDTDVAGVMIYQSMSGDASTGTGTLSVTDSTLEILSTSNYYKTAPMFFITNTDAVINLENSTLKYGSNILISVKGTSEWGNENENGGNVVLNATKQVLSGNIIGDNISTVLLNLNNSTYTGTINSDNSLKEVTLKLDKNSKIVLTGDSYVTELTDSVSDYSNIDFNGYKLYVNGTSIN